MLIQNIGIYFYAMSIIGFFSSYHFVLICILLEASVVKNIYSIFALKEHLVPVLKHAIHVILSLQSMYGT